MAVVVAAAAIAVAACSGRQCGGGQMKSLRSGRHRRAEPAAAGRAPARRRADAADPTPPQAARKVELRLVSVPAGARVVDDVDGAVLGIDAAGVDAPARRDAELRFEKDGYGPEHADDGAGRRPSAGADARAEGQERSRSHSPRDPSSEPAKLVRGEVHGPAGRTRFGDSGVRLPGHHLRGGGAGVLRLSLRGRVVGAQQGVADGGQPAAGAAADRARCRTASTASTPSCSRRSSGTMPPSNPPSTFDLPAGRRVGRRARRGAARSASLVPAPDPAPPAARARALAELRPRAWNGNRCSRGRPTSPGNFRHLHQLFDGKSVLIAYAAKKTDTGDDYYIAAKLDLGLIAKDWIPDELDEATGGHRARRDPGRGGAARSTASRSRATQFQYEASFGKTLYAWRIQITPRDVAELRAQVEHRAPAGRAAGAGVAGHHLRRAGRPVAVGARRAPRLAAARATSSPTSRTS